MSKKSNRNRHTGHINAYKARVIRSGQKIAKPDRTYYAAQLCEACGISIVRTA